MKFHSFLKQHGQTAVEYILMLAVSAGLGLTFMKKFQGYMFDNPDSYMNVQMNFYKAMFNSEMRFKKYRLPR